MNDKHHVTQAMEKVKMIKAAEAVKQTPLPFVFSGSGKKVGVET